MTLLTPLSLEDIDGLTREYGDGWGHAHVCRVLKLIELIAQNISHDAEVLTWAVYLHDWGAFPRYAQSGVSHALRSRQIVEAEILPRTSFTPTQQHILIEAVEKHDYQDKRSVDSVEALLLREADWLDMLGTIGIIREFAWGPNNLRLCYERILKHKNRVQDRFTLPKAIQIAEERVTQMNLMLSQIMADSFTAL